MQNTIRYALFLLIVSGTLFTGCSDVEEVDLDLPTNEEVEEETGIDNIELEEGTDEDGRPSPEVDDANSSSNGSSSSTNGSGSAEESSQYEDGTYQAGGTYASPAGPESIAVSLTVKDGKVTAVSITKNASNQTSVMFQTKFSEGISAQVLGKSLDEIGGYSSVNGSSLTPNGFDAALEAIKDQASS